ncbi:MAG: M20/M25/M40 family metallo-hydrolase [Candidatus Rokubacteria bacterium]|nr:M20/M25/M40 family metallo-hydrolase [Candidatus Rokubacteria bacterium]MBI3827653.1 M20/M25/M40 family metallo-hydrolase [Candidatus Rokubacteria bacterium]
MRPEGPPASRSRAGVRLAASLLVVLVAAVARGAEGPDWAALGREAVGILVDYIKVDTTNPPGNERRAVDFLKPLLDREGIETRVIDSAPGRANLYARLRGDGRRPALVLLNHLDVVPADARFWSVDPFAGVVKDGYVWGRGALDMKSLGVLQLVTLLALKRHGVPLRADVIFLGTADEEAGGNQGIAVVLGQQADLVRGAGVVLSEGAFNFLRNGRVFWAVNLGEKSPVSVTLTATGTPGHGSMPRADSAVNRLIAALSRVMAWETPIKVLPDVQAFYAAMAEFEPSPVRERLGDLATGLQDPAFRQEFTRNLSNNARVRNTISITMLEASNKINVIPATASARLDVRLLPGEDPAAFVEQLKATIADERVQIRIATTVVAGSSPDTHPALEAIRAVARAHDPQAPLVMPMTTGASDCRYFRQRGTPCYGFTPITLRGRDGEGFHGNDERVAVDQVIEGTRLYYEVVRRLVAD